jgi:hypothetical protein
MVMVPDAMLIVGLIEPEAVVLPVEVPFVVSRADKVGSFWNAAVMPVPLEHALLLGAGALPDTKLAREHLKSRGVSDSTQTPNRKRHRSWMQYLIQDTIWPVCNDADNALLPDQIRTTSHGRLAQCAEPCLLEDWIKLHPATRGSLVRGCTVQPRCLGVRRLSRHKVASHVPICDVALAEVRRETTAGSSAFCIVVKADRLGIVQDEMCAGCAGKRHSYCEVGCHVDDALGDRVGVYNPRPLAHCGILRFEK